MKKNITRLSAAVIASMLLSMPSSAHWNSKGPYGGTVSCMVTVDTNVLIGTPEGGIFINTNSAATAWKPVNQGMTSGKIGAVTQLGRKIIAGTTDAGIFISADRGSSWVASNNGLGSQVVQALTVSGSNVFAGTANGIYLSTDTGSSWTAVNNGLTTLNISAFAVNNSSVYAATNGGGVFMTSNAGNSWSAINTGLSGAALTLNGIVADGSMLYASNTNGVYMYMGGSWSAFNTGLTNTYVTALSISGSTVYAGTAGGVFTSNMMSNWSAASGLPTDTVTGVTTIGTKLFAGTKNNGIYGGTVSALTFTQAINGFNNLKTYAMATLDTNTIVTATNKGVFMSNDLAATYAPFNTGLTDSLNVTCILIDGTMMKFAGTKNAGVFMSMNNSAWSTMNTGLASMYVKAMAAATGSTHMIFMATNDGKVYSITPSASSWTDISAGLPSGINITSLATDGAMLYLGSAGNGVYHYMGGSWMAMNNGLTNQNVTALAVLNSFVYAGTNGGGIFKAAMMGTWAAVNTGLPSLNILSLNAASPYIVAGYRGGVYVSNNEGSSWVVPGVIANIPTFSDVTSLSIAKTRVFAGTPNNSLYSNANTELPTTNSVITVNTAKATGNVTIIPNPHSGVFQLKITELNNNRIVGICICDITGKKIQQLSNTEVQTVTTSLSSGAYFIYVYTDKGMLTQKMIVQ